MKQNRSIFDRLDQVTRWAGAVMFWFFIGTLLQYMNPGFFTAVGWVWLLVIAAWLYGGVMCIYDSLAVGKHEQN